MVRPRLRRPSWLTWENVGKTLLSALALVAIGAILSLAILNVVGRARDADNQERLRTRLDAQQQTIDDLNDLLNARTPVIEYIRDSEERDDCVRDLAIAADLAYGRLIVVATSLPEGERVAEDDPAVVAYAEANARLIDYDKLCPIIPLED